MTKIAIICTSFHKEYIEKMLNTIKKSAKKLELDVNNIFWIPGALEIPYAIKKIEKEKFIDENDNEVKHMFSGYVVLGIIEKGETQHGLVIGQTVINDLVSFQKKYGKPVGIGIIGPGAVPKQIEERIEIHAHNAIMAVDHMLKHPNEWREKYE